MPAGYRVTLGDGALDTGDTISGGLIEFTTDRVLGTGSWVWSGDWEGNTFVDEEEPGTYYLATDGNVYFVPDYGPVTTLESATALNPPTYFEPDGTVDGTIGDDVMSLGYEDDQEDRITKGDDIIAAGEGNDIVSAGAGDDTVYGGAGNDIINGNGGNDVLFGGDGNDTLIGGIGNDSLDGGLGNDLLDGGTGDDVIDAGDGNNSVIGGAGYDIITAGSGNDTLTGNAGIDSIYAGDGADLVYGGSSNDFIDGGAGDDTIFGEGGDDSILGGGGNDVIYGDDTAPATTTTETMSWSAQGTAGSDVRNGFTQNTGQMNVSVSFRDDGSLSSTQISNDPIYTGDGTTSTSSLEILGEAADTSTTVFDFAADPESGVSDNVVDVGFWITDIDAVDDGTNDFRDQVILTAYNSDGVEVPVTLTAAGNETIDGQTATAAYTNDEPDQAAGAVYVQVAGPVASIVIDFNNADGGTTNHAIWVSDLTYTTTVDAPGDDRIDGGDGEDILYGGGGNDTLLGGADNDQLFGGDGNDQLVGGTGDDQLFGGDGNDTIDGDAGADEIYGGLGDDSVNGGDGNDLIYGDAGADVLEGGGGNDIIFGGDGSDDISGGDGDDTLHGDLGDDTLYGGAGADVLFGGAGTNTLDGGADQDTFVITDDSGSNIITGGEAGDDLDTVDMAAVSDNVTVTFDAAESGSAEHGTNTTTFSEIEAITTGTGDDTITGDAGDVTISTGAGDDIIDVGAGNQVIYAGEGNDSISTGSGDDIIFGGDGDDTIDGGLGADWIDAGAGNDTITFSDGDTIFGGDGDDTFNYADLGEPTNGTIFISGGSDDETPGGGDTLNLGKNADWSTLDATDDGSGSFAGSITMDDGTVLNFTEIENIICFTPGTLIATPRGARDIASLRPGDFVVTRDHGMQPIRWIESRTVPARGRFAPIRITPGVVTGLERDLLVSPQHRMLFQGFRAELLFGESEVLAAAKHLVDGVSVTQEETDTVTYVHMMFDQHEIVFAEGAATESFHPGDLSITAISDPAREELFAIFPELRSHLGAYGQTARRCLKRHETELLLV